MTKAQIIKALQSFPDDIEVIICPPNSVIGYPVLSVQGITYQMVTLERQGILLNGALQKVQVL